MNYENCNRWQKREFKKNMSRFRISTYRFKYHVWLNYNFVFVFFGRTEFRFLEICGRISARGCSSFSKFKQRFTISIYISTVFYIVIVFVCPRLSFLIYFIFSLNVTIAMSTQYQVRFANFFSFEILFWIMDAQSYYLNVDGVLMRI